MYSGSSGAAAKYLFRSSALSEAVLGSQMVFFVSMLTFLPERFSAVFGKCAFEEQRVRFGNGFSALVCH